KNTADNDGDGRIGVSDGVDVNRNLPDHWGFTPEGSSDVPADQSYRGRAPASEPETQALMGLARRLRFRFIVNYHSFGRLLLYPIGWQEQTPTADNTIYAALAGTPINPAIPGYKPELSAALYSTNGETSSWAHAATGALAFTVELGEGAPGSGFLFPDNEALIAQEYEVNRPFAFDVARSAAEPTRPASHLGNQVPPIVTDHFAVSYGDPQPVQATVLRRLGPATLHWQVNGGPERHAPTDEWAGGLRYGATGAVWEHRVRGSVTGARPGDAVKVWFSAGGETGTAFTYRVEPHRGARLLVVAGGEHGRRAGSPAATAAGRLEAVQAALAANGVEADTYDVDAHGRLAPDPLGVLGHYAAVVWTADDAPSADSPGAAVPLPGASRLLLPSVESVSRLANEEMLVLRDYLNEGGRLLYTARDAGRPYMTGAEYDPVADGPCLPRPPGPLAGAAGVVGGEDGGSDFSGRCQPLTAEFFQYWLGAYEDGPTGTDGTARSVPPVDGLRVPFDGLAWAFGDAAIGAAPAATA
ncbi:MAG TPA: M14 family zinc carboxypeptidase, partial [Acidimicrobiia bacterium]|nr:M14 family zinc carboxypeptidase [Acidimicrobiia bacterium]